jgi:hypothetical protein
MAKALDVGLQEFRRDGTTLFVANAEFSNAARLTHGSVKVEQSVSSVEHVVDVPAGAIVRQAQFAITARAPGSTIIGNVAEVRGQGGNSASLSASIVLDFHAMRTVAGLSVPNINGVRPWRGTSFDARSVSLVHDITGNWVTFDEVQAERLMIDVDTPAAPADVATTGSISIPTPPSDLELLVNGVRAFFRGGPAQPGTDGTFATAVDLTREVQAAVDAGAVPVNVTLRSSVPGVLDVAAAVDFLRTFDVVFPEGLARALDAPTEGVFHLALPLPPDAASWRIFGVDLLVSARLPPLRILPADGPSLSLDAELRLDPDHPMLVRLPQARTAALATLAELRLPLAVGPECAEVAATVLADDHGAPGDPVPQGQLGPVNLDPGTGEPTWITLPLAKELKLKPEPLWVALQLARGSVGWRLAVPSGQPELDPKPLRRTPSGAVRPLSTVAGVSTGAAALRVGGSAPGNAPQAALVAQVEGAPVDVAATPTQGGVLAALRLPAPVTVTTPGAFVDGALQIRLTIAAPGSYSFSDVRVAYT